MPTIKPEGTIITIDGNDLYLSSVKRSTDVIFFQRKEFSLERLRNAPNVDGSMPIYQTLANGKIVQYSPTGACNPDSTIRSVLPDDTVIDDVFRRWDVQRWELQGAASAPDNVAAIVTLSENHKVLLDQYEAYLQFASAPVSWTYLTTTLQDISFDFLTSTGISMSSFALGDGSSATTIDNILVRSFTAEPEYVVYQNSTPTSANLWLSWSAVIDVLVEQAAESGSF